MLGTELILNVPKSRETRNQIQSITLYLLGWWWLEKQEVTNIDEDEDKPEDLCAAERARTV